MRSTRESEPVVTDEGGDTDDAEMVVLNQVEAAPVPAAATAATVVA
jgi:hypothetical protein